MQPHAGAPAICVCDTGGDQVLCTDCGSEGHTAGDQCTDPSLSTQHGEGHTAGNQDRDPSLSTHTQLAYLGQGRISGPRDVQQDDTASKHSTDPNINLDR